MLCLLRGLNFFSLVLLFLSFQANFSSSSSSKTQLCSQAESSALIQFKSSFSISKSSLFENYCDSNADNIKPYSKTESWKEGTDCCSWDGVTCDNMKGQVIGLDLSCSWLYGNFSSNSTLFHLPHLQKLNLAFNNFNYSKIPSTFGGLANLVDLNLSHTYFGGQVPSEVSYLSKLVSLDLTWGNYNLELDKDTLERLVRNLTELRQLHLEGIDMSSITPSALVNLSSSLWSLDLGNCDLQGDFPETIFHRPNLKSLYLRGNRNLNLKFPKLNRSSHLELLDLSSLFLSTESIDSISSSLQSLKYLYLTGVSFPGGFPDSIMKLLSLEHLDVSYANFTGRLPESIRNLVSLKVLKLDRCNMSGPLPISLCNLWQLGELHLSNNHFSGQIPSCLTNLKQLEILRLGGGNQLEGSIPDEVTAFPNLFHLDLSLNLLNGTLPSWLFTISSLKSISLSDNQFSGHIKEFQSKSVEAIFLDNNKLQGPIPSSISHLINLTTLSLSSNNLSGVVEYNIFSKLQNLRALDLSDNRLSFNFGPTSVDNYTLPNLFRLSLASCNVAEFPHFLKASKGLDFLDLSNNRLYGKIPQWMWDVGKDSLRYLNLSNNSLTEVGQLPWMAIDYLDLSSNVIHGDLPIPPFGTRFFFISNNSLSGEIPPVLCNASSLKILDLFQNKLTGVIPQCLGNLSISLWTLNLKMNKLYGIIPSTFAKGCQLSYLNLNGNQLEGPLTQSILHCVNLEVLDLGNNKINDTFPHWLASLPELQVLVLRENQLQGSISATNSSYSFSKLQILDLSSNYFAGSLPVACIKNFKAMINLTKDESAMSYMGVDDALAFVGLYSYSVGIAIKGQQMELVKIFTMLTSIDLSNNKFQGEIPNVIGKLKSLKGLNLSRNNLSGSIPSSIGDLISLEWLDLSSNKLVGKIPESLVHVTSLSLLNLSENQLHGQIPQGKQFNTFENNSYEGNMGLCGFPVSKGCSNNQSPQQLPPSKLPKGNDDSSSSINFGWKEVLIGYGCGVVFGLAVGYVVFQIGKPKWFVTLVEDMQHKKMKKSKIGNRSGGRRRI